MKSPTGKTDPLTANLMAEKSGLPTRAAISGVSRSLVSAVTTDPNAAPITTPTAKSTTLPRSTNCLNPLSMRDLPELQANVGRGGWRGQGHDEWAKIRWSVNFVSGHAFQACRKGCKQ